LGHRDEANGVRHARHDEVVARVKRRRVCTYQHAVILNHWLGDVLEFENRR
jgi:ribosome modulation factor